MAEETGAATLNLTPEEKRIYGQLFKQADTEGDSVVTGDVAVKFFERTRLDGATLGAIWQIADTENRGFLTQSGFSVVLRLIGHCQNGSQPSSELASRPAPLPKFEGLNILGQPQIPSALQAQTSGGGAPIRVPPLAPEKLNDYSAMFERAGARNGVLDGDSAKSVFEKSGLPNQTLGQVWALADAEGRGEFGRTQFVVAMHLLASLRNNTMRAVPQSLHPALFEAAARRVPPQAAAIPRQLSGQSQQRSPMSPRQGFNTQPLSTDSTGNDWLVTPQQKARFDSLFSTLDKSGTGYLSGEQAVDFFSQSGLSKDVLAGIWDLSEISSEGQLSRDEFAVAMFLIQLQKRDSKTPLPPTLPPNLIPPSLRRQAIQSQQRPPAINEADPFSTAPPKPKSALDDLFGLDAMSSSETPSKPAPAASKMIEDPFATSSMNSSPAQAQATGFQSPSATGASFKPFVPTSTFGQGLASGDAGTPGQPAGAQSRAVPAQSQPKPADDLLGDGDPEVSKKLTEETTELANMSNQITTLKTQMQGVQSKKATTERDVSASKSQKAELEARLAQFRTQYEQEVREVKTLEEQLRASRSETQKLQQELGMIEGAHGDLKGQHERIGTQLAADQQENATLKERIRVLNAEVAELKPQLEKLKSYSRQQKGLVAINKKQVATTEGERDRLQGDIKSEEKTIADLTAAQAAQQEQQRSKVTSPAASIASQSTNPFFRQAAQASTEKLASPPAFASTNAKSFDDFFGTSSSQPEAEKALPPPPPATSFPETEAAPSSEQSTSGVATPTMSPAPTPRSETPAEPPPPPESRQITSNALPLAGLSRTESFSSSVKANPPASRGIPSGVATPTYFSGSPSALVNGEKISSPEERSGIAPTSVPSASKAVVDPVDPSQQGLAGSETVPQVVTIPGAFPGGSPRTPAGEVSEGKPPSFETAASSIQHTPVTAEPSTRPFDDIEPDSRPAAPSSRGVSEFPPIRDLEQDDDSDSDDDGGTAEHSRGFSDSFAPPVASQDLSAANKDLAPPQNDAQSENSQLPTPTAQSSPPSYAQTVTTPPGERRESNHFPPEFGGLLPSREITHSPPEESKARETAMFAAPPVAANGGISTAPAAPAGSSEPTTSTATTKDDFEDAFEDLADSKVEAKDDEFDSAFDDLTDAKEGDDAAHESFGASRDEHEFNPTFTSPAPSKSTTFSFQTTPPGTVGRSARPSDGFPGGIEAASGAAAQTPKASAQNDTHDWDAIFSGLDNPPDLGTSNGNNPSPFDVTPADRPNLPPRGISFGTEHDDPILKSLTGMGYARDDALKALEKYDYNLDKAADYLTSRR